MIYRTYKRRQLDFFAFGRRDPFLCSVDDASLIYNGCTFIITGWSQTTHLSLLVIVSLFVTYTYAW